MSTTTNKLAIGKLEGFIQGDRSRQFSRHHSYLSLDLQICRSPARCNISSTRELQAEASRWKDGALMSCAGDSSASFEGITCRGHTPRRSQMLNPSCKCLVPKPCKPYVTRQDHPETLDQFRSYGKGHRHRTSLPYSVHRRVAPAASASCFAMTGQDSHNICIHMYLHIQIYIYTYIHIYIYKYIHIYIYAYIHTYICIHICTYIYIYIHAYIHIRSSIYHRNRVYPKLQAADPQP